MHELAGSAIQSNGVRGRVGTMQVFGATSTAGRQQSVGA
jgi:hypothetical protein